MLDIHRGLGLDHKSDQTQNQKARSHNIFTASQVLVFTIRCPTAKCRPSRHLGSFEQRIVCFGEGVRLSAGPIFLQQWLLRVCVVLPVKDRVRRHGVIVVVVFVFPTPKILLSLVSILERTSLIPGVIRRPRRARVFCKRSHTGGFRNRLVERKPNNE